MLDFMVNAFSYNENPYGKLIQINKKGFNKKLHKSRKHIGALTEQLRQLTKLLYGFKTEKLKNTVLDGQVSLF